MPLANQRLRKGMKITQQNDKGNLRKPKSGATQLLLLDLIIKFRNEMKMIYEN